MARIQKQDAAKRLLHRSEPQNGINKPSLANTGGVPSRLEGTTLSVAMLVIVLGGAGLLIWLDRVSTVREAHSTVLRLVHVLSEQTARTVQAVDLMLTGLGDELYAASDLPEHDPAFQDRMRTLVQSSPFIRALFVVGPDGFLTHDTNNPNTPPVSAADRDYFMAHAERDDVGLYVGQPLRSRRVGTWFVGMSRRVTSADGSFAGAVVAVIEPRYLASGARLIRCRAADQALAPILDEMDAAVERGATLASKLLTVSRQQDLALEVVEVNQLLSVLQPLLKSAAGPGVRLRLELASEAWPCCLDRTQFDRALLNLIINARDAMPNGGEVRVATANAARRTGIGRATRPIGDYVRVSVADNGQGMTPEVAQRVLEPFYTTKGEAGTGLGLSQVYGFVRQVGGDLHIESEPGAGTTVQLLFPRCASVQGATRHRPVRKTMSTT